MTAPRRRPGAPPAPSTDSAEAVGAYVTEVLTRLGDERDVYRRTLAQIVREVDGSQCPVPPSGLYLARLAREGLERGRRRAS